VVAFLRFLCFLSVALFLMNLLPIPAMDGGQILFFLVEIARKKPCGRSSLGVFSSLVSPSSLR